ncbi:hypothetical protein AKJ16_DCAP09541 [Drosera capensis]
MADSNSKSSLQWIREWDSSVSEEYIRVLHNFAPLGYLRLCSNMFVFTIGSDFRRTIGFSCRINLNIS